MRLHERCCEVCGERADLNLTSAHHARVIFFCTGHGKAFKVLAFLWHGATQEVSARIDFWLASKRERLTARAA
jgi:hypothetical protein